MCDDIDPTPRIGKFNHNATHIHNTHTCAAIQDEEEARKQAEQVELKDQFKARILSWRSNKKVRNFPCSVGSQVHLEKSSLRDMKPPSCLLGLHGTQLVTCRFFFLVFPAGGLKDHNFLASSVD
jgi:hypothetical protein